MLRAFLVRVVGGWVNFTGFASRIWRTWFRSPFLPQANPCHSKLPLPKALNPSESIVLLTADSEDIEVAEKVQLYAPNSLLTYPLVSPALPCLGLFIAGDKEMLWDEIIYACIPFFRIW